MYALCANDVAFGNDVHDCVVNDVFDFVES